MIPDMTRTLSFDFDLCIQEYQHIIWDWNGTLLDDVELCFSVLCDLLVENGLPVPELDQYLKKFRFPIQEYYRDFGFDFDKVSFAVVAERFMEIYRAKVKSASLFEGVESWLHRVKSSNKSQSILSAASQEHLNDIIQHFQIQHFFDRIFGIENDFAVSKLHRARELMCISNIPAEDTLLIGDTDHDLEVGRELGVDVLLIADGHQHVERLVKLHDKVIVSRFTHR